MTTIVQSRVLTTALNIGAPLLAIAAFSVKGGVPVGSLCTILAAALAGAAVPVFARFIGVPALTFFGVYPSTVTSSVFLAVCNAGLGALCALATIP